MENQAGAPDVIRLVTWNIEKGKRWSLLEQCLRHESIRTADLLCLNEVDDGMARSGNLRIAHEIGERLGMHVVFGQTFKEFTKGIGDELLAPGENTTAVQGNAILSRLTIVESNNLLLPSCFDHSKRPEKREGNRHGLVVRVRCRSGRPVTVANAHLEVFGTARCRGRQMKFLLDHIPEGPAIVTGDFNTNTFNRGTALHTIRSLSILLQTDVVKRTLTPTRHEILFRELRAAGFEWKAFNDTLPTCSVDLSALEDRKFVPTPIRNRILSRCRVLPLRLDFICCRGLHAVFPGRTITDLPSQPSDHLPIKCDIAF
jgi:endonuclease/exonuclease/phosphatase family metal-dependent hydrolase